MKGSELVHAYGIGAEVMKVVANLARQIKIQGGQEDDIRILERSEKILARVAKVLARAENLTRTLLVNGGSGFDGWADINLVEFSFKSISQLDSNLKSFVSRLATKAELEDLQKRNPGLLDDEPDLIIVGEKRETISEAESFWMLTKKGVAVGYIKTNEAVGDNYLFALV